MDDFWHELDNAFMLKYGQKGKQWLSLLEDSRAAWRFGWNIDPDDMIFQYVDLARELSIRFVRKEFIDEQWSDEIYRDYLNAKNQEYAEIDKEANAERA